MATQTDTIKVYIGKDEKWPVYEIEAADELDEPDTLSEIPRQLLDRYVYHEAGWDQVQKELREIEAAQDG